MKAKPSIIKTITLVIFACFTLSAEASMSNMKSSGNSTVGQSQQAFKYKVWRIDTKYLLHNLSNNLQEWENYKGFTPSEREVIWRDYQRVVQAIKDNRAYVRDDGILIDTGGKINDYTLYENSYGQMITESQYYALSNKEKRNYKVFAPLYYVVEFLNTICQACVDNGKYL